MNESGKLAITAYARRYHLGTTVVCYVCLMSSFAEELRLSSLRRRAGPHLRRVLLLYSRFARGTTLGAFGLVIDKQDRIFLVKHSYVAGWHLPGGGVETGETIRAALVRELLEEGNIKLTGEPVLHGMFHNTRISRRDHVVLFIVRDFVQETAPVPDWEIIAHGFFAPDELPEDTGRATRERIAEVLEGRAVSELW